MTVPDEVRERVKALVWARANSIGWMDLSPVDKTSYYENWTNDPEVGGVLVRYIDKGQVRVYLKDSLLKDYVRLRLADDARPLRVLRISRKVRAEESFVKPHGRRLADGRVVCWGRAEDWKAVLMALHERTHGRAGAKPFAAVFMRAAGRFGESKVRNMIETAARKLGIRRVVWLEV
jgi:hypothetical protein